MKEFITVQEAANYLRVHRSTIWRWCRNRVFGSAFKIGRTWRINRLEVEQLSKHTLEELEINRIQNPE